MIRMVHMRTVTRIICPDNSIRIPSIIWNCTDRRYQSSHPGTGLGMPPTTAGGLTFICSTHMQNPAQNMWWQTYMNVMIRFMYGLMMGGVFSCRGFIPSGPPFRYKYTAHGGFSGVCVCALLAYMRDWVGVPR